MKDICAIIPARSGSKRCPGKNWKLLNGKPLIEYTIDSAIASGVFKTIVVTSDSPEIKNICYEKYDFSAHDHDLIFVDRPKYLSTDICSSEEVIMHAMGEIQKHTAIMLLQPTSPFRKIEKIREVANFYINDDFIKDVMTVNIKTEKTNGNIYFFKWDNFWETRKIPYDTMVLYFDSELESIDIDTEFDFYVAELLMRSIKNDSSK